MRRRSLPLFAAVALADALMLVPSASGRAHHAGRASYCTPACVVNVTMTQVGNGGTPDSPLPLGTEATFRVEPYTVGPCSVPTVTMTVTGANPQTLGFQYDGGSGAIVASYIGTNPGVDTVTLTYGIVVCSGQGPYDIGGQTPSVFTVNWGSTARLSLAVNGSAHPLTGASAQFTLSVSGATGTDGVPATVAVAGANASSLQTTFNGSTASFSYTGRTPGTDTVTASAVIQGTLVTSNPVQVVWLPGPNSIPFNNGPSHDPTHKSPTDPLSDPINTFTGNFYTSANDTAVPAPGVPFRLERWYNSLDPSVGPLGRGWTSDLLSRLSFDDAGDAILHDGDGSEVAFQLQAGAFVAPPGSLVSLSASSGGYALLMHDASVQRFDAQGRLVSWLDPTGNGLSLFYSGDLLTQVQDSGGHSIGFSYDAAGHLIGVTLPNSTTVAYSYDGDLLTSVTDPAGKVTHYGYDAAGHLTTITDPDGATLITNRYDDQGRIVEQDDALGNTATFDWGSGVQTLTARDATGATWTDTYQNGELVQRVDPLGGTTSFTYDANFDLTSTTDPRGLTTTMTYDSRGNLTGRTYADGSSESWTYDDGNRVTSHTDADGNTTAYAYDGNGNLIRTTDPAGGTTTYTVDPATGLPLTTTDPLGRTTTYRYDSAGNLVETDSPAGARTTMSYDALGRLVAQTDPLRGTTYYAYDADGRLLTTTDPLGRTTANAYDPAGRLVATTDPDGNTTRHEYDAAGRKTADVAADGGRTTYSYDGVDNLVATTDPNGNTTRYGYDPLARETSMTLPDGSVWHYGYDADGNQTSSTDPLGHMTTTSYDARNRPIGTVSPLGSQTLTDYDANGNVIATYDPRGLVPGADPSQYATRNVYDSLGRLTSTTDPLGDSTRYSYDAAGQLVATTDPRGDTTSYDYDADGNQTSVTAADGSVTRYTYDAAGNVISRTDANGHVTRWTYDGDNEKTSMTNPIGAHWTYAYDPAGNLVRTVTASGGTISQSFDAMNRVTRVSYSDGTPSVGYAYDLDSNRVSMHDGGGTATYSYDANDQLTEAARGSNSFSYAYNPAGELTQRVYPGGFTTQLGYDADGNLVSASSPAGPTQYGYDAAGNLTETTFSNGVVETRTYDRAGRDLTILAQRSAAGGGGGGGAGGGAGAAAAAAGIAKPGAPAPSPVITSFAYTYDPNGNPTSIQTAHGTESYRYDERDRLVQACLDVPCQKWHALAYAYSYDPVGNMLSQQTPEGTMRYTYNAADELTSSRGPGPDATYSYDANGNETRAGATRYRYDLTNHIVSADGPDTFALYTYDGDGNMLTKRTHGDATEYQWDTNAALPQLAVEQTDRGNALRTYGYGVGGTPVTMTTYGRDYTYLTDKLGSVVELTDSRGNAVGSYRYDPYGALLDGEPSFDNPQSDESHVLNPILFTGQYLDSTTELYDLRARDYDSLLGQFLETDPAGGDISDPYSAAFIYADDRPTSLVDPSGMKALTTEADTTVDTTDKKQPCDLGCQVLRDPRITIWSAERSNIVHDLTTSGLIHAKVLHGLLTIAETWPLLINILRTGHRPDGPAGHSAGWAVDIGNYTSANYATTTRFMEWTFKHRLSLGVTQIIGANTCWVYPDYYPISTLNEHKNHVHLGFGPSQTGPLTSCERR
jgi:RHS repeat-associated protein